MDLTVDDGSAWSPGQNGSGKSTLIKILSGFNEPEPGASLTIDGRAIAVAAAARRIS